METIMRMPIDRRPLLATVAAAGSGGAISDGAAAEGAQNSAGVARPKTIAPSGATDSHIHITTAVSPSLRTRRCARRTPASKNTAGCNNDWQQAAW